MKPYRLLVVVYAGLLALLALTTGTALLNLGVINPLLNFGIATAKAVMVMWVFMELKDAGNLSRLAAAAGFYWVSILLVLGVADWIAR